MSGPNTKLVALTVLLLVGSVGTYVYDQMSVDRFGSGQLLIPDLDVDEVTQVTVRDTEGTVTLDRSGDHFVVRERGGYPAGNSSLNRLLRSLTEVRLERRLGSEDAELASELGIEPMSESAVDLTLGGPGGQEIVELRFGDTAEDGGGRFVRRGGEGGEIFLTSDRVDVDSEASDYLDRELVDAPSSRVVRIQGPDYVIERNEENEIVLVTPPGEADTADVNSLASLLSRLEFDEVYRADDPEVAGLVFDRLLQYELDDQSGYRIEAALDGERELIRISGFYNVTQIEIAQDSTDEELADGAGKLKRSDELARFNEKHGSWVYALDDLDGDKLRLDAADLLADDE